MITANELLAASSRIELSGAVQECRKCAKTFPVEFFHVKGERLSGKVYRHTRCKDCAAIERAFYRGKKRASSVRH